MGRLIDANALEERFSWNCGGECAVCSYNNTLCDIITEAPTVEAIPQADYENRLKADLEAILAELQLELEENTVRWYVGRVDGKSDDVVLMETINDLIQQKINALGGNTE